MRRFAHGLRARYQVQLKVANAVRLCCGGFFVLILGAEDTGLVQGADDDAHEETGVHAPTGDLM